MKHQLASRVPPGSLRWYPAGRSCLDPVAGDMLLVDHGTSVDWAIGLGERLLSITEKDLRGYTWARHAGLIRDADKAIWAKDIEHDGLPLVSEMGPKGHELHSLAKYHHRLYCVVHFDITDDGRQAVLDNDDACHDIEYGWWSYAPLILDGLTMAKFSGAWGSSMICSTHVTMCEMGCGLFPDRQASAVTPAHLAKYVDAKPPPGIA